MSRPLSGVQSNTQNKWKPTRPGSLFPGMTAGLLFLVDFGSRETSELLALTRKSFRGEQTVDWWVTLSSIMSLNGVQAHTLSLMNYFHSGVTTVLLRWRNCAINCAVTVVVLLPFSYLLYIKLNLSKHPNKHQNVYGRSSIGQPAFSS